MINNDKTVKMMSDMVLKANDSLNQLGELQLNTWNQLLQKQVSVFNTMVEKTVSQTQVLADAKTYQDVVQGQIDFSRQVTENMIGKFRESVEIVQDAGVKYRNFAESTAKEVSTKVAKAA